MAGFIYYIRLHQYSAVYNCAKGVGHLDHSNGETLAEGVSGELGFTPVAEVFHFALAFVVEFNVGAIEEAVFFEVTIEESGAHFFGDEGHAGIEGFGEDCGHVYEA